MQLSNDNIGFCSNRHSSNMEDCHVTLRGPFPNISDIPFPNPPSFIRTLYIEGSLYHQFRFPKILEVYSKNFTGETVINSSLAGIAGIADKFTKANCDFKAELLTITYQCVPIEIDIDEEKTTLQGIKTNYIDSTKETKLTVSKHNKTSITIIFFMVISAVSCAMFVLYLVRKNQMKSSEIEFEHLIDTERLEY